MAFKPKKFAVRKTKKIIRKRKNWKATNPLVSVKAGLGFPKKMVMTHKYFQTQDLSIVGGGQTTYQWRCNSLYDPDYSGAGHQPLYFDQMSALYNHYTVIGSKVTFTLAPNASNTYSTVAVAYINDDGTITPTYNSLVEQSNSKYKVFPFNANYTKNIQLKWSAKKTFGGSVLGNNSLLGSGTTNPSELQNFAITIYPQSLAGTATFNLQVMIEYIAVWTELIDVNGS